jgi:hypothetical protein
VVNVVVGVLLVALGGSLLREVDSRVDAEHGFDSKNRFGPFYWRYRRASLKLGALMFVVVGLAILVDGALT